MDFKELDELRKKKRKQNDEFAEIDKLRYPDKDLSLDLESLNRSYDNVYKSGNYDFDAAREYNTSYIDSVRKIQNYAARNTLDNKTKSDLDNLLSSLDKQQSALSDLSSAHRAERQFIEQFPSKSSYNVYRASVGDYDEYSDLIQENKQELKDYKKEHGGKIKNILNRYNVHDSESADAKEEEYKRNMEFINRNKADTQRIREIFEQDIKENKYNKLTDEQKADIDRYVEAKQKHSGIADQQMLMGLVDKNYSTTSDSLSAFQEMKEAEENIKDIPEWELLSQYAQREKNRVEMERTLEKTGEMANKHQVLSTIGSVAYTPAKIVALKQVLEDYNNDVFGVDVNSPYFAPTQISGKIRDTVMEEHDVMWRGIDLFDFVYSTTVSLLDSAASAALGGGLPVVGGAIIGSSAAAESMLDAAERGLDPKSVLATGLMSGVFETFFESISIAKFKGLSEKGIKNLFSVKGLKTALGNVAKSALTNASEEILTEIAEIAYDTIANGDFSNFKRLSEHYISEGKTEEAKKLAIKDLTSQVIQAGAGGALQGVLGGVGASAIGALRQDTVNYKSVGEQIKGTDFAQRGMEYAKEIGGEALKRADKAESYSKALNYIDESSSLYKAIEGREKSNLGKMAEANAEDMYSKKSTSEQTRQEVKKEVKPERIKEFTQPTVEVDGGEAHAIRMIEQDGIKQFYLTNAETIPVSEANFVNADVESIYNNAKDYDFDTARYFVAQAARAENIPTYISAFDSYYKAAAEGTPVHFFEQYQKPEYANSLSQEVKEKVYQLGTEKFKEALSTKEGVQLGEGSIRQSGELGEFGVTDSWAISAVGNVAKATGVNFVVFSDEDSSYNGWYDAKNNEIYVNLKGDYSIVQTAGHELTHFIRERNEEGYQTLKNFLLEKYEGAGGREAIDALVVARQEVARNNKENARELTYDQALEEVVAESCQNMLKDTNAIQELAKQNKTLFEYIKEWIEGFVRSIKEAFKGVDKISAEYEWLTAIMNDTTQLQEIWDKALVGAVTDSKTLEKSGEIVKENSENEIKFSDRDSTGRKLTKEQIEFFKDSKVRDEDGNLLVVYHGTNTGEFNIFSKDAIGSSNDSGYFGKGFYFAFNKSEAKMYGSRVVSAYLKIKNPFYFNDNVYKFNSSIVYNDLVAYKNFITLFPNISKEITIDVAKGYSDKISKIKISDYIKQVEDVYNSNNLIFTTEENYYGEKEFVYQYNGDTVIRTIYNYDNEDSRINAAQEVLKLERYDYKKDDYIAPKYNYVNLQNPTKWIVENSDKISDELQKRGFDGVIQSKDGDEIVVFSPNQIKSVDNLNPTESDDIRYSDRDSDNASLDAAAIRYFGKTKNWSETGYLLKDGTMLDFSGKNNGAPGGYRTEDHRAISDVYDELEDISFNGDSLSDGMIDYMSRGNIRIMPESNGINLSQLPTQAQENALNNFIKNADGEVVVDFDNEYGDTVESAEYPIGTRADRVLRDIRRYFKDGISPEISDISKFMYSDRYSDLVRSNEQNEKVIARLNETVQTLENQLKLTHGLELDKKGVKKIARKLIKESGTTYSAAELSNTLMSTYDNYRKGSLDGEDFFKIIRKTAEEMYNRIDGYILDDNQEALNYLKNCRFRLSESQKTEVKAMSDGSTAGFRDSLFGSVVYTIDKSAPTLDALWSELNGEFPHLFPEDTIDRDMPGVLVDVIDELRTPYYEELEYYKSDIIENLNLKLLEQYFEAPIYKTFADKQNERRLKDMARLKKEYDARIEKYKQAKKELREKVKEERRIGKEKLKEYKSERKATAERRKHLESIEKNSSDLVKWLSKPKQGYSVPTELKESVIRFMNAIDYEKGTLYKGKTIKHDVNVASWKDTLNAVLQRTTAVDDSLIPSAIVDMFNKFTQDNTIPSRIYDMSLEELTVLDNVVKTIKHTIQNINRTHAGAQTMFISDIANSFIANGNKPINQWAFSKTLSKGLFWGAMDSFTYFHLLGDTAQSVILENLREGFNSRANNTLKAMKFFEGATEGIDFNEWREGSELHTFKGSKGGTVRLTVGQIMSLYLTMNREKTTAHLYDEKGGIVSDKAVLKKHKDSKRNISEIDFAPVVFSKGELDNIISILTPEQKAVADKLQKYLADVCGKLGNEVTQKMWLYDGYTEKDYYPIFALKDFLPTSDKDNKSSSFWAIKNMSFTKSLKEGAKNPIVIRDIFDVWKEHTADMIAYNAFTAPLSDAMRWFNYKDNKRSVRNTLEAKFTDNSIKFFTTLIEDINGSNRARQDELAKRLISTAKTSMVGFNLSVVAQQPTAFIRAATMVEGKYLTKAAFRTPSIELAKKYSPIAAWKALGFFDTDIGRGMESLLLGNDTRLEKLKEGSLWLVGKADEVTWGYLWNAIELQVADQTNLKSGTEEFYKEVGKRLSKVVDDSQVVDTVFHRPQAMRRGDAFTAGSLLTFFSEQAKCYNMAMRAMIDVHNVKDKRLAIKKAMKTFTVIIASQLMAKMVSALVRALRDKDEDETYAEKLSQQLFGLDGAIVDGLNIFNNVPYLNIIMQFINGFDDVTPLTFDGIKNAYKSVTYFLNYNRKKAEKEAKGEKMSPTETKKSLYNSFYAGARAISSFTGVPISNVMRAFEATYNAFADEHLASGYKVTNKYKSMVESLDQGDKKAYDKIYSRLQADGYTDDVIQRGIQGILKDDERIKQASQARQKGEIDKLDDIRGELETKGFEKETVIKAIDSVYNQETKGSSESKEKKDTAVYKNSDLINALDNGYIIHAKKVITQMKSEGKDDGTIRAAVTQRYKEKYFELKYDAYVLNNKEAEKKITELKEMLNSLDIGYDYSVYRDWDKKYYEWKQVNK